MKKTLLILSTIIVSSAYSQKITENKKDDMTNNFVISTSKERLSGGMSSTWIKTGVTKINSTYYIESTIGLSGSFFIIRENAEMIIKLSNDSIIKLVCLKMESAHEGMGGKQADVSYRISDYAINQLKTFDVKKIRIYTTDGYTDIEVSDKNKSMIKNEILLIEKSIK